ncbi:MAG: M1 family metallopeptidase [Clostridia bacterium]|nr:M1 family metallopeptidase [Clostridia bacterium]
MKKGICITLACVAAASVFSFGGCKKKTVASTTYEITAKYEPENATLAGAVKVSYENTTENELTELKFQLHPNAYRKDALYRPVSSAFEKAAYYKGESYGEIVVSSVNGAKNWEVTGEDDNILSVYLEKSLFPEDKVVLDIAFTLKLAKVNHRTGVTEHTANFGNFFPILCGVKDGGFYESVYYSDGDPFLSECANYSLTLTAPKDYKLAVGGEITGERTLESKKEYTVSATNVRDLAFVLSDEYKTESIQCGDTTITYYYYDDTAAGETLTLAKEAFSYFEKTFGEYPYPCYTLAQTGFCYGGMEYPALAFLSDTLDAENKTRAVVHETAHQWWYAVVGSDQLCEAWQDEGLAEYSALMFFESNGKYGITREDAVTEALKEYRSYYDVYGSVLGRTDTKMHRSLKEFLSDYEYQCIVYDKSVVMFDTLRKSIGDKKFTSGLKKYYADCKYKVATPDKLIASFEKTGADVRGFFESFLDGKAIL